MVGTLSGGAIQGLLQWFESSQAGERGIGRENFARFCGESCKFRLTSRRFCGIIIRRPAERGDPAEALSVKFCEDGGGGFSPAASCGMAGEDFHRPRLAGRRGEDSAGRVSPLESCKGGGNIHPGLCPAIVRSFVRPAAAPAQKSGKEPT